MHMVRKRVPERDVEDVVQATLTDAVTSASRPEDPDALRRWIWGVARHKVADFHRRSRREEFDEPEVAVQADTREANDMLRWAMQNVPEGSEETLQWLIREADGEKLESIAESAQVPPARVRKRVSRLRAHLREHWKREVIALAALGVTLGVALWILRKPRIEDIGPEIARPEMPVERPELKRAKLLRQEALDLPGAPCQSPTTTDECLRMLDQAKELDPAGDTAPAIQTVRLRALPPPPAPIPTTTAQPMAPSKPEAPKTKSFTPTPNGSATPTYTPLPIKPTTGSKKGGFSSEGFTPESK
jgi:RNA polymerase sigma factor (sigma-70 family)